MNDTNSFTPPPLQLGVRAHDIKSTGISDLIHKIEQYKLKYIQLAPTKSFPQDVPNQLSLNAEFAEYCGQALEQAGIQIEVLGCYVNMVHPDEVKRTAALESFKLHLRLATQLGARLVGTETGTLGQGYCEDNFTEAAFASVINATKELVSEAERQNVMVGIEAGTNHPLYTAQLALQLVQEISSDHLRIILDCANLMTVNNYEQQDQIIEDALALLEPHIAVIHLKDFVVNNGKIEMVPVGKGILNFDPILKFMKYKKPHLRGLIESTPESALADSIAFLHQRYDRI